MRGVRRLGEHWASVAKRSEEQQHQTITGDASTSGWMSTAIYCSVEAWSTSIKNPAWGTDVRDAAELLMEQPREKVRVEHEVGLVRFARWFFFSLFFPGSFVACSCVSKGGLREMQCVNFGQCLWYINNKKFILKLRKYFF